MTDNIPRAPSSLSVTDATVEAELGDWMQKVRDAVFLLGADLLTDFDRWR